MKIVLNYQANSTLPNSCINITCVIFNFNLKSDAISPKIRYYNLDHCLLNRIFFVSYPKYLILNRIRFLNYEYSRKGTISIGH